MATQVFNTMTADLEADLSAVVNARTEDQEFFTAEQKAQAYALITANRTAIETALEAQGDLEQGEFEGYPVEDLFTLLVNILMD